MCKLGVWTKFCTNWSCQWLFEPNVCGPLWVVMDVRGVQLLREWIDPPEPLCMRMPALFSEKSLFSEGVCRADSALGMWTVDAGDDCMLIREKYACRTTGTCECAPASQVDAMHSIYMLIISGIPSPPHARGVCITSATLSLPVADPRKPRVRCIHCDVRPRTRSSRCQTGTPLWMGKSNLRMRVLSRTSHICANEGCSEEHFSKNEVMIPASFLI